MWGDGLDDFPEMLDGWTILSPGESHLPLDLAVKRTYGFFQFEGKRGLEKGAEGLRFSFIDSSGPVVFGQSTKPRSQKSTPNYIESVYKVRNQVL